jgi:hypothetical protein
VKACLSVSGFQEIDFDLDFDFDFDLDMEKYLLLFLAESTLKKHFISPVSESQSIPAFEKL